jgi:hypothetical protein
MTVTVHASPLVVALTCAILLLAFLLTRGRRRS